MSKFLQDIVLHLSDIGLLSPCSLPLERIASKERLADNIASFYSKLSRLQLKDIFLTTINQIEGFLLSKTQIEQPRTFTTQSSDRRPASPYASSTDTFNRLYNHHFEKLRILEYKKKLSEHEPQCTFVPVINKDRFHRKVLQQSKRINEPRKETSPVGGRTRQIKSLSKKELRAGPFQREKQTQFPLQLW